MLAIPRRRGKCDLTHGTSALAWSSPRGQSSSVHSRDRTRTDNSCFSTDQYYGIEWDDPTRGKHDGSFDNVKYFECRCVLHSIGAVHPPPRAVLLPF
jgi:hypothetical protein